MLLVPENTSCFDFSLVPIKSVFCLVPTNMTHFAFGPWYFILVPAKLSPYLFFYLILILILTY
jgi:hypothetical protein